MQANKAYLDETTLTGMYSDLNNPVNIWNQRARCPVFDNILVSDISDVWQKLEASTGRFIVDLNAGLCATKTELQGRLVYEFLHTAAYTELSLANGVNSAKGQLRSDQCIYFFNQVQRIRKLCDWTVVYLRKNDLVLDVPSIEEFIDKTSSNISQLLSSKQRAITSEGITIMAIEKKLVLTFGASLGKTSTTIVDIEI